MENLGYGNYMKRFVALGIVLAGLVGAPSAQARYLEVGGQRAQVLHPVSSNGGLVLYVHGAGQNAECLQGVPIAKHLVAPLVAAGFTVATSDAHGVETWGSAASVEDYVHLVHRLHPRRVYIVAQSMGGLDGVQLIDRLHPDAWAGIYPVDNMASIRPYRQFIAKIWGSSPPKSLSPAKADDVAGMPVMIWASPEDKVVPKVKNADVLATWMRSEGAKVTEFSTEGEHGDVSNFQPRRLIRLFDQVP